MTHAYTRLKSDQKSKLWADLNQQGQHARSHSSQEHHYACDAQVLDGTECHEMKWRRGRRLEQCLSPWCLAQ